MTLRCENVATIELPERLNAAAASTLKARLEHEVGHAIQLDASQTVILSAQTVQVLIAAKKTWNKQGLAFSINGCGREFLKTFELLDVAPELVGVEEIPNGS